MLELIKGKNIKSIKGLSYLKKEKIIHNPSRELNDELDKLPFPARELLPMEKYNIFTDSEEILDERTGQMVKRQKAKEVVVQRLLRNGGYIDWDERDKY